MRGEHVQHMDELNFLHWLIPACAGSTGNE